MVSKYTLGPAPCFQPRQVAGANAATQIPPTHGAREEDAGSNLWHGVRYDFEDDALFTQPLHQG